MKVLYLDESGDHNLNLKKVSQKYPVFVLGGVIVDRAYVRDVIEPRMREFKLRFFGRDDVILHTVDMGRSEGDYAFLADPAVRSSFYMELNRMLAELEYKVVACAFNKFWHVMKYGKNAADPYMYSLDMLVERFCKELGDELDGGFICAEKRNPSLDRDLMHAWEELRTAGTDYVTAKQINDRIVGLDLRDKKPNLAGLQLADLVVTPIGRHIAKRPPKADQVQWNVVEGKFRRRSNGSYLGVGLVARP